MLNFTILQDFVKRYLKGNMLLNLFPLGHFIIWDFFLQTYRVFLTYSTQSCLQLPQDPQLMSPLQLHFLLLFHLFFLIISDTWCYYKLSLDWKSQGKAYFLCTGLNCILSHLASSFKHILLSQIILILICIDGVVHWSIVNVQGTTPLKFNCHSINFNSPTANTSFTRGGNL